MISTVHVIRKLRRLSIPIAKRERGCYYTLGRHPVGAGSSPLGQKINGHEKAPLYRSMTSRTLFFVPALPRLDPPVHGLLLQPGQCGSTRTKGFPSPVVLWDYKTRTSLFVYQGLTEVRGINNAFFIPALYTVVVTQVSFRRSMSKNTQAFVVLQYIHFF